MAETVDLMPMVYMQATDTAPAAPATTGRVATLVLYPPHPGETQPYVSLSVQASTDADGLPISRCFSFSLDDPILARLMTILRDPDLLKDQT